MNKRFEVHNTNGDKKRLIIYNNDGSSVSYLFSKKELYELFGLLREIFKND
jgi:hypothetical protein